MDQEEFSLLMSRKLSGEISEDEMAVLERLVESEKDLASRYHLLLQYWNNHKESTAADVEASLRKVLAKIETPVVTVIAAKPVRYWSRIAAAAMIIAVLTSGILFVLYKRPADPVSKSAALIEKSNSKGTKSVLQLSDGSRIWLNADSRLIYPQTFSGKTREVTLNGEAFFDVAKNAARPFIIHLSNGTVRVLGTSFNVRAYDNENKIETSVATGKVAFIPKYQDPKKKQDTLFITPDRKLKYVYSAEELILRASSANEDKAWTEGKLIFKSMKWEEIAFELERNFGKKIVFEDDRIRNYRLTGYFQNNSLEEILYYLSKTSDFSYLIRDQDVKIFFSAKSRF